MERVVGIAWAELKSLRCPCGFEVRSRDEDEIVRMAQLHAKTIHGQEITVEQAKALIQLVA
jgi:predicted small metal-binding protein